MAIQTLKRWGNSLAVRIPSSAAARLALTEGQEIEVEVEDGVLTVRAHTAIRRFSRERYLRQLHERKLEQHPLADFGAAQGVEFGGPDDPTRFDRW